MWLIFFDNVIYSFCQSYCDYNIHGANPVAPININSRVDWALSMSPSMPDPMRVRHTGMSWVHLQKAAF